MKKIIATVVILLVAIIGWFWLLPQGDESEQAANAQITPPWIEVESAKVVSVDESGKEIAVFASGDIVSTGTIIKTDATGQATIYFADGSNLRIDPDTTVTITEGNYDEDSGSLKVRVALMTGKVWSKITALVTPESHWEVRTGTAVATVRGSAFGTEVTSDGETLIVGSEHDIAVAPIDEETGEVIAEEEVIVSEQDVLTVRRDRKLDKRARRLEGEGREDLLLRDWIERNEERDGLVRDKIEELQAGGFEGRELRQELRQVLPELIDQRIEQRAEEISERTGIPETEIKQELETRVETKLETRTETTQIQPEQPRPTVISLEVKTRAGLKVSEGVTIEFEAVAVLSDGTRKVVTDLVSWQVVGSIGSMIKPGVFQAALGADVSEIGTAFGAVTASHKAESGKEFFAKSEIITVTGAIATIEERGQGM